MNTAMPFIVVGVGGFIGSVMRYALSLFGQRFSVTFPHGTLWSNLLGCLVIGVVTALAAKTEVLSPTMRLLLATGLCGGFTTMSTFTYEMFKFVQAAEYLYASGYFLLTMAGCAAMFCLGMFAVGLVTKV
jgi:CrcB protein